MKPSPEYVSYSMAAPTDGRSWQTPLVQVNNASNLPVYDATIFMWLDIWQSGLCVQWQHHSVFPPTANAMTVSAPRSGLSDAEDLILNQSNAVTMKFRDAAGNAWYRSKDGILHEMTRGQEESALETFEPTFTEVATVETAQSRRRSARPALSQETDPQSSTPEAIRDWLLD